MDMNNELFSLIRQFKQALIKEFGSRLFSVTLFGSVAEDRVTEASDIDIAVVVSSGVDWHIKQRIYDLAFEAEGDSGRLLNVIVFSKDEFEGRSVDSLLLIENILKQGITV
jgi:predicted nucleotidyltransferase